MPAQIAKKRNKHSAKVNALDLISSTAQLHRLERVLVGNMQPAQTLWNDVLDADERLRLGGNLLTSFDSYDGAIEIWRKLYSVSRLCAVIDVALALNLITVVTHRSLSRHIEQHGGSANRDRGSGVPASATDAEIQNFVSLHLLVLVRRGELMSVYWSGREVIPALGYHDGPARCLRLLAISRRRGRPLNDDTLAQYSIELSLRDAKYRLMELLRELAPPLASAISSHDEGGYWLDIDARDICLLTINNRGHVRKTRVVKI